MLNKIKKEVEHLIKYGYDVEINNNYESIFLYHKTIGGIVKENKKNGCKKHLIKNYYWFEFHDGGQSEIFNSIDDLFKHIKYFFGLNKEYKIIISK